MDEGHKTSIELIDPNAPIPSVPPAEPVAGPAVSNTLSQQPHTPSVAPKWDTKVLWYEKRAGLLALIALVGFPLTLIGAIYPFFASEKTRDVRFSVSETATTIVKAGQSSDLTVQYKGKDLATDVSSVQVQIWNAGRESVHRWNILTDSLTLKLDPPVPILEVRIKKMTRDNVVRFEVDATKSQSGTLGLSWNILENNDGALLEVIYAGNSVKVVIDGQIEGKVPIRRAYIDSEKPVKTSHLAEIISWVTMGIFIILGLVGYSARNRFPKISAGIMAFILLFIFLMIGASIYFSVSSIVRPYIAARSPFLP